MKRSVKLTSFLTVAAATLLAAAPAFAVSYEYSSNVDDAVATWMIGVYCCAGAFGLVLFGFWIWMIIDALMRQEYEFPGSTGSSKTMWLLILFLSWLVSMGWIAAIVYYFMVFRKVKRGSAPPPGGYGGGYQPPMAPTQAPPPPPPQAPPPPPPPMG